MLACGYKPDAIRAHFGTELEYVVEPEPLGTGGAIAYAAREAGISETFVACNGDVLTDLDLTAELDAHERTGALATLGAAASALLFAGLGALVKIASTHLPNAMIVFARNTSPPSRRNWRFSVSMRLIVRVTRISAPRRRAAAFPPGPTRRSRSSSMARSRAMKSS